MKSLIITLVLITSLSIGCTQTNSNQITQDIKVGGPCEGCEATVEYGDQELNWEATLPDFNDEGQKIDVSGTVYELDGKTPAKDVILYVYHTDQKGIYPSKNGDTGWAKRHGYLRTWLKTNELGQYKFLTLRPASYPNTAIVSHIHIFIKEPGKTPYYIDDFLFDDDPFLTQSERNRQRNRGGNGILKGENQGEIIHYKRDIILGLNVENYK